MYWSTIVFKLTNRLMSKDFYAYKQAEMVGQTKASKTPSITEAVIDPMDERQANEMNSILGIVQPLQGEIKLFERARARLDAFASGNPLPIKSADEQSPEDKEIVAFVKTGLEEARQSSARVAQEGINLTNIAYLCGFDSIYFDGASRQFKPIPTPSQFIKRNRVHVNRILPTVQNRLAKLLKNEPRWDVRPKSGDEDDKDAARLAEQVIIQLWDQLHINQKRIPMTMWLQQAGIAYFKISWDPSLGSKQVNPKPNLESGEMEYEIVAEGDIRVDVASFFEVYPDPMAKSWDELTKLWQAKIRPLSYFPDQYGDVGKLVKQEDCWLNSLQYEMRINSINTQTGTAGSSANQMKNCAIEISYYEKPSRKHPYGRHIITANGVKLKDDVLPIDELPFVKFDDIIIGGKFNAEAIITHLRPLQDQLNRGKSMRAAWLNRMLTGKIMSARGHNLAAEAFNDQSGEIVQFDPVPNAQEPHALQTPIIPEYAYKDEEILKEDIDDTAGINGPSRGQPGSAQMPAIGMQLLVEQDDSRIGVETESHEYSYADLGRILLKFVARYYKTDRLLKFTGENMEYVVRKFQGNDIKDNFDVHVIRGSTLPGSKVLKRQEIINLHQQGYFGNPTDPTVIKNVLSMLEFGDEYQAFKRNSLRMNQIQRGLKMIEELSEKPPVCEFDDHALWIQQLDDYRIGEKYLKMSPEQQTILLTCMEEHLSFLQDMVAPQPDADHDPHLKPTTAAQEEEQQLLANTPAQDPNGPPPAETGEGAPPNAQAMNQPQIAPPPGPGMPPGQHPGA